MPCNVQIETDEGESQTNRFCLFVGMLRRVGIDDVLMDKRWIAVSQRVTSKLIVKFLI